MPTINKTFQRAHKEYHQAIAASADMCQSALAEGADASHTINLHRARVRGSWMRYQSQVPAWARTALK